MESQPRSKVTIENAMDAEKFQRCRNHWLFWPRNLLTHAKNVEVCGGRLVIKITKMTWLRSHGTNHTHCTSVIEARFIILKDNIHFTSPCDPHKMDVEVGRQQPCVVQMLTGQI